MNLIALVLFLLFCPLLFVFLLKLGSGLRDESCPFCNHEREDEVFECSKCGFYFMSTSDHVRIWLWGLGALGCIASLVLWIESQAYL